MLQDRILATCDSNGLEYINDLTNFQPSITVRNAIRQCLSQCASGSGVDQNARLHRIHKSFIAHPVTMSRKLWTGR